MESYRKLEEIFINSNKTIEEEIKTFSIAFIKELKVGCKTYDDVYEKLIHIEKEIKYNYYLKYLSLEKLFEYVREMLDKEKNGLKLTNRLSWL